MTLDASDRFRLEDVCSTMTVGKLTEHVARWLRTTAPPGAAEIANCKTVRLAVLRDTMPACSHLQDFAVSESVRYRCRDGVPRNATIVAKHRPWDNLPYYTIRIDDYSTTVSKSTLSMHRPRPPLPANSTIWRDEPAADAATDDGVPSTPQVVQMNKGDKVWFVSTATAAPRRARIDNVDDINSTCIITIEGDERNVSALNLAPPEEQSDATNTTPGPSWTGAEIEQLLDNSEQTVGELDLYNRSPRLIVVSSDVDQYWERWSAMPPVSCPHTRIWYTQCVHNS